MAGSLLRALVSGTRQMLAAQLFVSVVGVALAGWTLVITSEAIKERDRLQDRIVQLEGELGARGIVVPPPESTMSQTSSGENVYPPEIGLMRPAGSEAGSLNPGQIITDVFAPPPALSALVLHVRSEVDRAAAARVAGALGAETVVVTINVMAARDARASAYAYYDGRQSRAAAALVARFNDASRSAGIPQWSAQPRALALPAEGEFTAERLDIILPPLPETPAAPSTP